jgi:carbamoyltransferase
LGKVVDLAAYGDEDVLSEVFRAQLVWDGHRPRLRRSSDVCLPRRLAGEFAKIDLAAAFQAVLEEIVVRYVAHHLAQSGLTHIVLSGSLAVNAKLVQRVHEIPGVERIYVHPNMGEGGCGVGAAQVVARRLGDQPCSLPSVYLGPDYSARQLHGELVKADLPTIWYEDIEDETARLLADDYVVARFAGRLEYGPRALGNRSILCAAKNPDTTQALNDRLHRSQFIPFSPATLAEDAPRCYQHVAGGELAARFMTIAFNCTPWMRQNSPAAVHVDGTARPQLVTSEVNPSFHRILAEYKRLTGLPTIINTRFHLPGEPLVCSPHDAIRAFLAGGADYLAMGNYLVPSPRLRNRYPVGSEARTPAAQHKRQVTPPLS